jgi:hypothetical protein
LLIAAVEMQHYSYSLVSVFLKTGVMRLLCSGDTALSKSYCFLFFLPSQINIQYPCPHHPIRTLNTQSWSQTFAILLRISWSIQGFIVSSSPLIYYLD